MSRTIHQPDPKKQSTAGQALVQGTEPMVDAREAAVVLRLPHYWFANPVMRERYRIPHYMFGDLVRFRVADLYLWAKRHTQDQAATSSNACATEAENDS